MLNQILEQLKAGITPTITWDFSTHNFLEMADDDNDIDGAIDCYPTVYAKLTVGENTLDIHRTFGVCIYLTDGNLTTVTFTELEDRTWGVVFDHEDEDEDENEGVFDEIIGFITLNHRKLLEPDYCDMTDEDKSILQSECDSMLES